MVASVAELLSQVDPLGCLVFDVTSFLLAQSVSLNSKMMLFFLLTKIPDLNTSTRRCLLQVTVAKQQELGEEQS